ncbi:MAG: glutamine amidotransferase [Planctomycetota bacterium]
MIFERIGHIRFTQPLFLLVLIAAPVLIWMARRSIAGLGRMRAHAAMAARVTVLLALVAALAGAQFVRIRKDMAVAFVVDKSLSVPERSQREALALVDRWQRSESKRPGDKVALITFGDNAAIDQPFTEDPLDTVTSYAVVEPEHTNIEDAIRAAVASMPEAGLKRIVLVSDGNENDGAAASEASSAKAADVRIDCLPVRYSYEREVMVEKVIVPPEVSPGKTVEVRILVRSYNDTSGTLRLFANDALISSTEVALEPGINAFSVERTLSEAGVYDFQATIECLDDTRHQNNAATAFSVVRGPKKVLIVEGKRDDGALLARALTEEKISVDLAPASGMGDAVNLLSRYDTVILVNVAAYDLAESQIKLLESAVKDYGLGLVMVGGEDSFGAGGWRGTPVEEAMPVSMDVKDRQVVPAGALVIVNHSCEFSDGNRWGIEVSKAALNTLGRYDEFGVLYYDWQQGERWLINLQPVTDRVGMKLQLEKMMAGDMPSFASTLKMAHAALKKSEASVKHIVIISDGDAMPPTPAFLQTVAADGITISTVAVFPHDMATSASTMQMIAKVGNGRFYYPRSATQLPQIFIKEARMVRRGLIFEETFIPKMVIPSVPVTGFADGDFPALKGYVITSPKPLAETPLLTHHADPLLAHWQYGLGRTVAFTSDAKAKWAAQWVDWGHYKRFWGQVVEWVERKVQQSDFSTSVSIRGDTARVTIDAIDKDGEYVNFLQFTGNIMTPKGEIVPARVKQVAPGRYEWTFKASEVGTYLPLLKYKDADGATRTHMMPVTVPFSAEYKALATNEVLLAEISEISGGEVVDVDTDVFRRDFPAAASYTDIWQWVLGAGIIVFLADVFIRRVIVDYEKVAAAARYVVSLLPGLGWLRRAPARSVAYTSRLLSAKKSVVAGRKFQATEEGEAADLDGIMREQAVHRAQEAASKRRESAPIAEVAKEKKEPEEDGYTSRLLRAKKKAREDQKF